MSAPASHPFSTEHLRERYTEAVGDAGKAERLLEDLADHPLKDAVWLGYRAATEALLAKFAANVFVKLDWVKRAGQTFAEAVGLDAGSVEVRYLRFALQHNVPSFLGLNRNLEEDRRLIVSGLSRSVLPASVKQEIARFVLASDRCTADESTQLETLLRPE